MTSKLKNSLVLTLFIIAFVACRVYDKPPSLNTPEPSPHNGVFVNGKDTLWMNGDGKTIRWHFEKALPEIGQSGRGEYVFLFGHGKYRYEVHRGIDRYPRIFRYAEHLQLQEERDRRTYQVEQ